MKLSRRLQIALATAVCTAAAGQSALAGTAPGFHMVGEPKNVTPFTDPVGSTRQATGVVATSRSTAVFRMVGEPKNMPPFTGAAPASSLGRNAPDAIARYLSR